MAEQNMTKSAIAWLIQFFLAVVFLFQGILKFYKPEGLPQPLEWVYDLSGPLAAFIGIAELVAVVGLILPGMIKRLYWATPAAASGLIIVMIGAVIWHLDRGEPSSTFVNIFIALMAALLVYLRRDWLRARSSEDPETLAA